MYLSNRWMIFSNWKKGIGSFDKVIQDSKNTFVNSISRESRLLEAEQLFQVF